MTTTMSAILIMIFANANGDLVTHTQPFRNATSCQGAAAVIEMSIKEAKSEKRLVTLLCAEDF